MFKQSLLLISLLLSICVFSQEIDRVKIEGKITAPKSEDVEGVTIYNISSQKGTVTSLTGDFELEVAENDRVAITALQFTTFTVIVDKGVIDKRRMGIYLNPVVNQLDEVIVRPYDLSGNIVADVARIKTANVGKPWDLSYETMEFEYEFSADKYSSVKGNKAEEAYHNGQEQYGGDLVGLAGLLVNMLLPKRKKNVELREKLTEKDLVASNLRQRFSNAFLEEHLGIEEQYANDFIYYAEENGMQLSLLKSENEIMLLDFMRKKSLDYKERREKQ